MIVGKENITPSVGMVESLIAREQGANSRSCAYTPKEVGKHGKNWKTILNGKNMLNHFGKYFRGYVVVLCFILRRCMRNHLLSMLS